jgi:hypothetical protein
MNRTDVKIIQVSSEPKVQREVKSFNSLSQLGYRYIRIINPRYMEYPPTHNVFEGRTDWIVGITKPDPNKFGLTAGHYGAFQGHMMAILSAFVDSDYTFICESDCLIATDHDFFFKRVDEAIELLEKNDHHLVRFESANFQTNDISRLTDYLFEGDLMINGHCYLLNPKSQYFYLERMKNVGWHTPDWWLNFAFQKAGATMPYFKGLVLTKQAEGFSLIDSTHRQEKVRG